MSAAPVIFLDLDDVLITHRASHAVGKGGGINGVYDSVAMGLLNQIIMRTNAVVVLCTAHRDKPSIRDTLKRNGFKGKFHRHFQTDRGPGLRGDQVQRWLDGHPEVTSYLILDDGSDFLPSQAARHVRPPMHDGINFQNYRDALKILGASPQLGGVKFRPPPRYD